MNTSRERTGGPPTDTASMVKVAMDYHGLGDLEAAAILYAEVLAREPAHFTVTHLLGALRNQQGDFQAGAHFLERALKLNPRSALAHLNLGIALWNLGRSEEALAHYQYALFLNPDHPETLMNCALALHSLDRNEEALASLDTLLALQPEVPEVHLNRGIILRDLHRPQEALVHFGQALLQQPDFPEALFHRGNALMELHRPAEALASYDQVLTLQPDWVDAHMNRGSALVDLQRMDEALASYDHALVLQPDYVVALMNRGKALHGLGRHLDAVECYDRALAIEPENPAALSDRGNVLLALEWPQAALASYDRALAFQAGHADALMNRGTALLELKRPVEALASYDRALALRPDWVDALMNRGTALAELHRTEEALASYSLALALQPDHIEALWNRFNIFRELWRPAEALIDLETALAVHAHSPTVISLRTKLLLATALLGVGQYAEAEQLLKEPSTPSQNAHQQVDEQKQRWHLLLLDWLKPFRLDPLHRVTPFTEPGHRYVFPLVVWGDSYLDTLEQFTLPSLLAPGNLPHLCGLGDIRILVFTTESGAKRLKQMPVFRSIEGLVAVDILTFPSELTSARYTYKLMSAMHLVSMEIAKASRSHFFFLAPDLVFSDNFLRTVDQRMRQGADVIFVPGLILHLEAFGEELSHRFPAVDQVLSISPGDLLELGVRHVHPFVKETYTYTPNAHRSTVAVFLWPLASGGYVMHGYHHTPFLVSTRAMARFDGSMFNNLDGDFLPKIIRTQAELERCDMVTDPTEATYFELSRSHRFGGATGTDLGEFDMGAFDTERLCRFGRRLGPVARWLFPKPITFDPANKGVNDPARMASALFVDQILQGMKHLEEEAASSDAPQGRPFRD